MLLINRQQSYREHVDTQKHKERCEDGDTGVHLTTVSKATNF